jgi:hypothetical protein
MAVATDAGKFVPHAKDLVDAIVAGDDLELVDAGDGWELLLDFVDGEIAESLQAFTEADGRVVAIARRSGGGVPFVLLARIPPHESYFDDPWCDLGGGD